MLFGMEREAIELLGATYTATEINQQPEMWQKVYSIISEDKERIQEFIGKKLTKDTRIILTGAGTSDYVGDTIALHLGNQLGVRVEAIATTDLVSNPKEYIERETPTILVSYARSGNSPESIGAYDIFNSNVNDIAQLVITCNANGKLANRAEESSNNLCLLMPEESNDKSFAMTSSFSCMLLSSLLVFDINNLEKNKKYIDIVSSQGIDILKNKWIDVKELVDYNCERVVYLGSGALKGLCQEMALKNLELTSGKTVTVCESVLGFRHGPKSIINDNTLVIIMNSIDEHTNLYDMDLINEIHNDLGNHKLCVMSYKDNIKLNELCTKYININGQDVPEIYTVFNYMLLGQVFGLFSSLKLGISPDNPRPDGTVNRVVQGVTIHEYNS